MTPSSLLRRLGLVVILCLTLITGATAIEGYTYLQEIEYSGCDQDVYQQDIVIHRATSLPYTENLNGPDVWHIYVGDHCREDYGDVRFTDSTGAELAYYLWPDYDAESARFTVRLEGATSAGVLTVYYGNPTATTTSDGDAAFHLFDHFDGTAIDTGKWDVIQSGGLSVSGGELRASKETKIFSRSTVPSNILIQFRIQSRTYYTSIGFGNADLSGTGSSIGLVYYSQYESAIYSGPSYGDKWVPPRSGRSSSTDGDVIPSPPTGYYTEEFVIPEGGKLKERRNGGEWTVSTRYDGVSGPKNIQFCHYGTYGAAALDYILVRAYSATPPSFQSATEVYPALKPSATKTYSGTIQRIDAPTTGNWFAVSTTSNLYLQQVTSPTALGTTTTAARVGAPYDLALANDASFYVEGRNNLIDIFRTDGAQVGTYTAGGPVRHVDVARANGLYAAAGSDDGKYYVFSKDASSSWYLLHVSDSASPVTALAMSWRGETLVVGRSDGHLVAFRAGVEEEEEEFHGTIRILVYKDALPYTGARLVIEHGGTDQTWGTTTTIITDDYGVATAQVRWGEYVRVTVGENELQRVILPNPQQTEYVFRIKGPDPLRTGAQYSSGYDPDTRRIYLHYDDTRGKTHLVQYKIIRSVDNAVVFQREYSTLPVNDYYQIPAGWTNTSYRIQLTASGSPSFTNTWSQWVGTDGVASLPADLDTYARMGIAFFLILFVAGLFSYLSGPQGAVVVSLFAGALVLWGWLPLPPTVIALCIVWAFLGLLGRTSGE